MNRRDEQRCVSAGKLSAPALAALRQVTGAVARCRAGALPPTRSRPAIGFRYDPSLDLVAPTAPMPHPDLDIDPASWLRNVN